MTRTATALLVWAVLATAACVVAVATPAPRPPEGAGVVVDDVTHVSTVEGNRVYRVRDGGRVYNVVVRPDSVEVVRAQSR